MGHFPHGDNMKYLDASEVVRLYTEGWSMQSLARRYGVDNSTIKKRLVDNGVELRTISESVRAMLEVDEVMRDKTGRKPKYNLNVSCLGELTDNAAYVLGFFQADGYVSHRRVSITLQRGDEAILEQIKAFFDTERPLRQTASPFGAGISLDISSVKLASAFHRWGIKSPKSHIAHVHPDLRFNRHYWRGIVDGDGTLCVAGDDRRILRVVGSEAVCRHFLEYCQAHHCGLNVNVCRNKGIFSVGLSGREAIHIAYLLYSNAEMYLPRKMAIYEEAFCV